MEELTELQELGTFQMEIPKALLQKAAQVFKRICFEDVELLEESDSSILIAVNMEYRNLCKIVSTPSPLPEVGIYSFIGSNGHLAYLPNPGDEIEVSDNGSDWKRMKYSAYCPDHTFPVYTDGFTYRLFRKLQEPLVFREFLEENGMDWEEFLEHCRTENQRWGSTDMYYENLEDLKQKDADYWLLDAFNFEHSHRFYKTHLITVSCAWQKAVRMAERNNTPIKFEE